MQNTQASSKIKITPSLDSLAGSVNSPVRSFKQVNREPMLASKAEGAYIYDTDGNKYLDFCMSWGTSILGHANSTITDAVMTQCHKGTTYGVTTEIEARFAQKITSHIPTMDQVRFVSSGTEATMSAARLARGFTQKNKIIKFIGCYHGHADQFLVKAGSSVAELSECSSDGVSPCMIAETILLPYNDHQALTSWLESNPSTKDDLAAIILEPIAGNMGCIPPSDNFIETLNQIKRTTNCLIIADEVITGFRFQLGDISRALGLNSDIICLGKIIGGGFPAAAFGARKEIMNCLAPTGGVYQAGTLSGNPVAMTAGMTAISLLEESPIYDQLSHVSHMLIDPVQAFIDAHGLPVQVNTYRSIFSIFFNCHSVKSFEDLNQLDTQAFTHLFNYLYEKGIFIPPSAYEAWFISSKHTRGELAMAAEHIIEFIKKWYRL